MSATELPDPAWGDRPRSYSTLDVARRLGVSAQTVQRWVDAGRLRAWVTPGGHRRIDVNDAERLFAEHARNADSATPEGAERVELSVLVVDDSVLDRDLVLTLVRRALPAARIETAESGFDALLRIGRSQVDLLIADLLMPHMNGFEMLRHLAADGAHRPSHILAMSSHSEDELRSVGTLPDDVGFLPKPLSAAALDGWLRARSVL